MFFTCRERKANGLIRDRFHDARVLTGSNEKQKENSSDWQLPASHVWLGDPDENGH